MLLMAAEENLWGMAFSTQASASSLKFPLVLHTKLKPRKLWIFSKAKSFFFSLSRRFVWYRKSNRASWHYYVTCPSVDTECWSVNNRVRTEVQEIDTWGMREVGRTSRLHVWSIWALSLRALMWGRAPWFELSCLLLIFLLVSDFVCISPVCLDL